MSDSKLLTAAKAIWSARSYHPIAPYMTWVELIAALDGNPQAWLDEYERLFRQARAAIAALEAFDNAPR